MLTAVRESRSPLCLPHGQLRLCRLAVQSIFEISLKIVNSESRNLIKELRLDETSLRTIMM